MIRLVDSVLPRRSAVKVTRAQEPDRTEKLRNTDAYWRDSFTWDGHKLH